MVTMEYITRIENGEYSDCLISEFYVNNKEVSRRFFIKVMTYYSNKYSKGFYFQDVFQSRKIKRCSEYIRIKYYSKKDKGGYINGK